jgi:hypothetical protein
MPGIDRKIRILYHTFTYTNAELINTILMFITYNPRLDKKIKKGGDEEPF